MENQPIRPWLRLASQSRIEPPQPRPPLPRPTVFQALGPPTVSPPQPRPQPQIQGSAAQSVPPPVQALEPSPSPEPRILPLSSSSSLPPSPTRKPSPSSMPTSPVPATYKSPKLIKPTSQTPTQFPNIKPLAPPPPSPLSLPPSQLKPVPEPESKSVVVTEQKNMLSQEEKGDHDESHKKSSTAQPQNNKAAVGVGGVTRDKEKDARKKLDDHEELDVRVITLAGDNKGAYMELVSSYKKQGNGNSHLNPCKNTPRAKIDGNESGNNSSIEDGKSKRKQNTMQTLPMTTFVNSNVQAVNNSILFNTSCALNDPGVHLAFLGKKGQVNSKKHPE